MNKFPDSLLSKDTKMAIHIHTTDPSYIRIQLHTRTHVRACTHTSTHAHRRIHTDVRRNDRAAKLIAEATNRN